MGDAGSMRPTEKMFDVLPTKPTEQAVRRLQKHDSYMKKAPLQRHRTWKRAFKDALMRLSPCTWFGPTIIKAHDRYEYTQDRKLTEEVYTHFQEKRKESLPPTKAIADLDIRPAPLEIPKVDPDGKLADPWELPPMEEMQ